MKKFQKSLDWLDVWTLELSTLEMYSLQLALPQNPPVCLHRGDSLGACS